MLEAPPPPDTLEPKDEALLAGATEWWCWEFNLGETPAWVHEPRFWVDETYDMADEILEYLPGLHLDTRPERQAKTPPEFLRHNVICLPRHLIVL